VVDPLSQKPSMDNLIGSYKGGSILKIAQPEIFDSLAAVDISAELSGNSYINSQIK
jgi:hypothetical protein